MNKSGKHSSSMAAKSREARVSRDGDGNILGVALFVGADDLPDIVAKQQKDRISYITTEGRVILQV